MPERDNRLHTWAVPDIGQPLDEAQREVLDAAFEIMEELLGGPVCLIVARPEFGGYSFMEPRHKEVDFERVKQLLLDIVEYMLPDGR
jgi:hypothetical protein